MNFTIFLIFILQFFALSSSQSVSCNFGIFGPRYFCDATIENSVGFDGFHFIFGSHRAGYTDNDVQEIRFIIGTSPILPRIYCDTFRNVEIFTTNTNRGVQRLTVGALENCRQLQIFEMRNNPIIEIQSTFFLSNVNLNRVNLENLQVATLHSQLFRTVTRLTHLEIANSQSIVDLPANIFQDLTSLTTLGVHNSRLGIWRPEWIQSLQFLNRLWFHGNQIAEIPRNAVNQQSLRDIWIQSNQFRVLDFFMFNDIRLVTSIQVSDSPVEAIDFNLIDRATSMTRLASERCSCVNQDFTNFNLNRASFMAQLEPCFAAFDRRILSKNFTFF